MSMQQLPSLHSEKGSDKIEIIGHRIFINNVDSYHGKQIAAYLGAKEFGTSNNEEVGEVESLTSIQKLMCGDEQDSKNKYEIIGALSKKHAVVPEGVEFTIDECGENFKEKLLTCGVIIYDITLDNEQMQKTLSALSVIEQDIERYRGTTIPSCCPKIFILISTIMTWGLTNPLDPEEPDIVHLETDYKRRQPHPNYEAHYTCENEVLQKGRKFKEQLKTYVVCSGLTYGLEEDNLFYLFKRAWSNERFLPIFGSGNNYIPLIHVADLARVLYKLISSGLCSTSLQYVLAVEQAPCTLKQIVNYLSIQLGNGKTKCVAKEEAFLYSDIEQETFDRSTVNLIMEPDFITETLQIEWQSEMNLVENMASVAKEFKTSRQLEPKKIIVLGPPCSGKTRLAKQLADYYNLKYVFVKCVLEDTLEELRVMLEKTERTQVTIKNSQFYEDLEMYEENAVTDNSDEEKPNRPVVEEKLKILTEDIFSSTDNRVSDESVASLLRATLSSNWCQNQGYIIDGYPKTLAQAKGLFNIEKENKDLVEGEEIRSIDKELIRNDEKIIPNYIISLDGSNEFLLDRISRVPEKEVQGTHYTEREMIRRLMFFRENNPETNRFILDYFDDNVTDIIEIDVEEFAAEDTDCMLYIITKMIGPSIGFGLTKEEINQIDLLKMENEKLETKKQAILEKIAKENAEEEYKKNMTILCEEAYRARIKEEKILISRSDGFRSYLMKYILPSLSKALINLAHDKPPDPVDFLAEYLFKNNTDGKMYNPGLSRNGEELEAESIFKECPC